MGIIQKQSFTGAIWSYIGVGLGFLTTAILFTRILETEEIGLLRILVSYSSILSMFAGLGMNAVTVKMFPQFRDEKSGNHGFTGIAILVTLVGFALTSLAYILMKDFIIDKAGEDSTLFVPYFYLVLPLALFTVLFTILDSYFRVLFRAVRGIIYKEVLQRLLIIVAVVLYFFRIADFGTFVWLYVLAYLVPVVLFGISLASQKNLFLQPDFKFITPQLRKEMISVGFFGILGSFSSVLVQSIDSLMVNNYLGLSLTGIYTVSFFFGTLILIPLRTMTRIGGVVVSEAWKRNDLKTISEVYSKSSITLTILGLLFFIGIWGNIENVFHLIGDEYRVGKYVILFISLANVVEALTGLSPQIIVNSRYYRWNTWLLLIFSLLIVLTNLVLIPVLGITGAAVASFISKLIFHFMKFLFLKIKFGLQPFSYRHLLIFAIAAAAWYLSTFIPVMNNYIIDIAVRSVALTVLFVAPVYGLKISEDFNLQIIKTLQLINSKTFKF
jgi:O-antigen/teichoic acid export membrane protein